MTLSDLIVAVGAVAVIALIWAAAVVAAASTILEDDDEPPLGIGAADHVPEDDE